MGPEDGPRGWAERMGRQSATEVWGEKMGERLACECERRVGRQYEAGE